MAAFPPESLAQLDASGAPGAAVAGSPGTRPETKSSHTGVVWQRKNEVKALGLEPKTYGLKVRCSTN
jgi:hypothetical protein